MEPTLQVENSWEMSHGQDGVGDVRSWCEWLWVESLVSVHPFTIAVEHMIRIPGHSQGLDHRRVSQVVRSQSALLCLGS